MAFERASVGVHYGFCFEPVFSFISLCLSGVVVCLDLNQAFSFPGLVFSFLPLAILRIPLLASAC